MLGLTLGIGLGTSGGGGSEFTGTLTLTAIESYEEKRIYQRATTTGGGQSKGQGTIPLTISGALAGTIGARVVDADTPTTVLQDLGEFSITDGQTTLNVTGVDARLGWFFVELQDITGVWQRMTYKCGMGAVFGLAGQSLTVRMFGRQDGQGDTYSSLSVTPSANSAVLASYNDGNSYMPTVASAPWITPGDVGDGNGPNAVGIGEFLNRMITLIGVNCGAFGHAQTGVQLSTFVSGQSNWTRLAQYITRVGGAFEGFIWGQGHNDGRYGTAPKMYGKGLDTIFNQLTAANSFAGYGKYVWTVPNIRSSSWGTPYQINQVRKGGVDWAAANSATYIHMYDVPELDNVHQTQTGSRTMGRYFARALRAQYGASSGIGPVPVSATRSGTTITLTLSDAGQTNLTLAGSPGNRIFVFPRGRYDRTNTSDNRFPVSSVSVTNATTLSIVLADDPGDGHELDLWVYWPNGPTGGTADTIHDDIDPMSIGVGRMVAANTAAIQIAAPSGGGAVNAPPGGFVANLSAWNMTPTSAVYGATDGDAAFDQMMTSGRGIVGGNGSPCFTPCTVEGWFTCPTIPASTQVFFGGFGVNNAGFVGLNSAGRLTAHTGGNSLTGATTTLVAGKRYYFAWQFGPGGRKLFIANITDALAGILEASSGSATNMTAPIPGTWSVRNHAGSSILSGGAVDEVAIFNSERYADATEFNANRPTLPFAGTETDLIGLYRCNGNVDEAVGG
jgi:hypothetical protein